MNAATQNYQISIWQKLFWHEWKFDPANRSYHLTFLYKIHGDFNQPALVKTLTDYVNYCHPGLKRHFIEDENGVWEVESNDDNVFVKQVDISGLNQQEQELFVNNFINEITQPFDLTKSPLYRFGILELNSKSFVLCICTHHILLDGVTMKSMLEQLSTYYNYYIKTRKKYSHSLIPEYKDYLAYEIQHYSNKQQQDDLKYWTEYLKDAELFIDLPAQQGIQKQRAAKFIFFTLEHSLVERARQFAQQRKTTIFRIYMAAYAILLARYSTKDEIVISYPTHMQPAEFRALKGCFVKTCPMRLLIDENDSFIAILNQVETDRREAKKHPTISLTDLIKKLKETDKALRIQQIFNVAFVETGAFEQTLLKLEDLEINFIENPYWERMNDLTFNFMETSDGYCFRVDYNHKFNQSFIEQIFRHYKILLSHCLLEPENKLHTISMLNPTERSFPMGRCTLSNSDNKCTHQLFEEQVIKTPNDIALVFEETHLTYLQLNQKSNQLAHYLKSFGVKPESLVIVCMERSLDLIISILAIHKAGGAYVPLDPTYPTERLKTIVKDTNAQVLLISSKVKEHFTACNAKVVILDNMRDKISEMDNANLSCISKLTNLAYVIYTSGSTGIPKGVMVEHRALFNHMEWMGNAYSFRKEDRFLLKTSVSFDASIWEIFMPLFIGAQLIVAPENPNGDPVVLINAIKQHQVTVFQVVPSYLKILLEQQLLSSCDSLKQVFVGGEAFTQDVQELFFTQHSARLHNLYGPTEATIDAIVSECKKDICPDSTNHSVIGKPIANTQVYLLDKKHRLVPPGVIGEIYIGGQGLARGYLNCADLTAEKFIVNPFAEDNKSKLYKTGDLACYLPDGNIVFIGRIDHQIKIRGFRVELNEIENVLRKQTNVKEAIVVESEQQNMLHKRLIAYILPQNGVIDKKTNEREITEFRRALTKILPDYMLPHYFILIPSLPYTASGKVDRKALLQLYPPSTMHKSEHAPPANDIERQLVKIYSDVFNVSDVGMKDNFFELGGHSLLAMQLIARLRETIIADINFRAIFEYPCLADLAAHISEKIQLTPVLTGLKGPISTKINKGPASFSQQSLWLIDQYETKNIAYNVPLVFKLRNSFLNIEILKKSLYQLVHKHEILRTFFNIYNEEIYQEISTECIVELTEADFRQGNTNEIEHLLEMELSNFTTLPFDLTKLPLFRVKVIDLPEDEKILVICFHHIIIDGVSFHLFLKELSEIYNACKNNKMITLEYNNIRYIDFAQWQYGAYKTHLFDNQISYWQNILEKPAPYLELPYDKLRAVQKTYAGRTIHTWIDAALYNRLKNTALLLNTSLYTVLLTTFAVLLYRYTGQDDILISSPVANRQYTQVENVIGLFINIIMIRANLSGAQTFTELIKQIENIVLGAFSNQEIPVEKILETLTWSRDVYQHSLFQVMFVLQTLQTSYPKLLNSQMEPYPITTSSSKFDLLLDIEEINERLLVKFQYNTALFFDCTVQRMVNHLMLLLDALTKNTSTKINECVFLTPAESQTISNINNTEQIYPDIRLEQKFEIQSTITPNKTAVISARGNCSYERLASISDNIRLHLIRRGASPNQLVAIVMEKGWEQTAAILGILKSGAAYLPISPKEPMNRLHRLLEQGEVKIVLTQSEYLQLEFPPNLTVLNINDSGQWDNQLSDLSHSALRTQDLAYVIFTSGSTGIPKGVMINHKSAVNTIEDINAKFRINENDVILGISALNFDLSVYDIFGALSIGATVVLPPENANRDPAIWTTLIKEHGITVWDSVPALMQMLVEYITSLHNAEDEIRKLQSIRLILLSGDWIPLTLPKQIKSILPHARIIGLGGATEGSIWSIYYPIEVIEPDWKSIPYGKPLGNQKFYVLNEALQFCPMGVKGNLYIGGIGVAAGYWRDTERTAASFVINPGDGKRIYKTGDIGKYRSDGNIEFLGRIDSQVKIRGFRIELGEIEACLDKHPAIQQSIVIDQIDNNTNTKFLSAYIILKKEYSKSQSVQHADLQKHVSNHLPEYMVPSAYVFVDSIPLSPNGKVDHTLLPQPLLEGLQNAVVALLPKNADENKLALIWEKILNLSADKIHSKSNFFVLGGYSLLALRTILKVNESYGINLKVRDLFENPTFYGFLDLIKQEQLIKNNFSDNISRLVKQQEFI